MKKRIQVGLLSLFILLILVACQSEERHADGPGGFLWKVEQGDTLVYLQGTIHIGEESFYPLDNRIEQAYESSDVILPEIDLNNQDEMQMMRYVLEVATYDDGETLEDHLPAGLYAQTVNVFEEIGLPFEMFKTYRPWFIQTLISETYTQQAGYDFFLGIDQHFLDRAAEDGKEIRELESYEEQMELLSGFSDDVQLMLLADTIATRDVVAEQTKELVSLWVDGDVEGMLALVTAGEEEMSAEEEAYMKALNDDRNIAMTEKIIDILEEDSGQTYFVMVGAMHMIAEPSIVSILRENGYEVEHVY